MRAKSSAPFQGLRRGDERGGGQGKDEGKQGEGGVDEMAVHEVSGSGTGAGSG